MRQTSKKEAVWAQVSSLHLQDSGVAYFAGRGLAVEDVNNLKIRAAADLIAQS
jgi:hypothetical protein